RIENIFAFTMPRMMRPEDINVGFSSDCRLLTTAHWQLISLNRRIVGLVSPPAPSNPSDGWLRCRLRCRRESIHERESDRASRDRFETSPYRRKQAGVRLRRGKK